MEIKIGFFALLQQVCQLIRKSIVWVTWLSLADHRVLCFEKCLKLSINPWPYILFAFFLYRVLACFLLASAMQLWAGGISCTHYMTGYFREGNLRAIQDRKFTYEKLDRSQRVKTIKSDKTSACVGGRRDFQIRLLNIQLIQKFQLIGDSHLVL